MRIERAIGVDLPALAKLGPQFFVEGRLPGKFVAAVFVRNWQMILDQGRGAIWTARDAGGEICGALGALVAPDLNDGELVAQEAFWFVAESARGSVGVLLFAAWERWAKALGVKRAIMIHLLSSMPQKLQRFYHRRGYRPVEVHYVKVFSTGGG